MFCGFVLFLWVVFKKSTFSAIQLSLCKIESTDSPVTMGACGQLQGVWDGEKLIWIKINFNENGHSVQIYHDLKTKPCLGLSRFNPQLRACFVGKDKCIERSREDFVYLFWFQYRHHSISSYNLWWMQAGLPFSPAWGVTLSSTATKGCLSILGVVLLLLHWWLQCAKSPAQKMLNVDFHASWMVTERFCYISCVFPNQFVFFFLLFLPEDFFC